MKIVELVVTESHSVVTALYSLVTSRRSRRNRYQLRYKSLFEDEESTRIYSL
jgi:hypothetical protein